nr:hypothetical protein BaRGS_010928 [Batillaria attramentaria]
MPVYKVNVKWGKEKLTDVELNTDEPPIVFKAQLFALCGVQPERQKLMIKGAVIKLAMPAGLTNLGNTCYMNATIQCLRAVPELKETLKKYSGGLTVSGAIAPADSITAAFRDLNGSMDRSATAIPPIIFLQVLHMAFPRFAEKGEGGGYVQQSKLRRIPAYLTIQFVRFHYKESKAVNAKLLRDVKFPLMLDVFDLCSPELQQKLMPMREKMKDEEEKQIEQAREAGQKKKRQKRKRTSRRFLTLFLMVTVAFVVADPGSNNSGFYELSAVLTHKGRSSSSGHYVAWVRKKKDDWLMFDDDRVAPVKAEDILKLSGGGDWHCAYVLLYSPRVLEVEADS